MNKYQFFFSILFFNSYILFSQVQGVVLNNEQSPLDGVNIYISEYDLLIKTGVDGVFLISESIPNNSYLEFYKKGYQTTIIQYNYENELKIVLKKLHVELDEIGIRESISVLGSNKLLNIEQKSLSDNFISYTSLVENINQLTGVSSIGSGLGIQKIVIRGLSGLRVVTYLNGMRISNQEWANDHSIGFTDLGISKVELIKGASSLQFGGDAVGGILYFSDEPFVESTIPSGFIATKFDNSHMLFGNQFGVKMSRNNFYFKADGEYSQASDYRLPDNTYLFNSRFLNKAYKFSVAYFNDKIQSIFRYQHNSDHVGIPAHACNVDLTSVPLESLTSSSFDLNEDYKMTRPTQYINNHLFTLKSNYFSNQIKYSFFVGYFINNLQEFEKWTIPAFDMDLSTTTLRFNLDFLIKKIKINTGLQYQNQDNFNNISSRLIPDASSNDFGYYLTMDFNKNNFGFNSGVRFDYKNIHCKDFEYNTFFPSVNSSLGFFYKQNDHISRITYSSSYRAPHLSELFSDGVHHGTMRYEIGNISLDTEKSHQFDFKYQYSNDHIGFVVNPFVQFVNDFISINPVDSFYINTYRIYNYIQYDNVQLSGLEINFHYHPHLLHNLHFEQYYSFINAVNIDDDVFLAFTPSNKIKTKLYLDLENYSIPLSLNNISIYHLYSFSQDNVALYEPFSSAYNIVNVELMFNPFNKTSLLIGVNNLFNEEYVPHLSRIRDVAGGVPQPGRSFNISLKYEF
ncbi:MAG: hypothetical protein CMP49_00075 [Flavobacteriales bacterium]|nr:hypothetical protein [Flavobacteriales bacterium]